jgi:hypothetical protein
LLFKRDLNRSLFNYKIFKNLAEIMARSLILQKAKKVGLVVLE